MRLTEEEFLRASLYRLGKATGIAPNMWRRYFLGKTMNATTLVKASKELGIETGRLLELIYKRSDANPQKPAQ